MFNIPNRSTIIYIDPSDKLQHFNKVCKQICSNYMTKKKLSIIRDKRNIPKFPCNMKKIILIIQYEIEDEKILNHEFGKNPKIKIHMINNKVTTKIAILLKKKKYSNITCYYYDLNNQKYRFNLRESITKTTFINALNNEIKFIELCLKLSILSNEKKKKCIKILKNLTNITKIKKFFGHYTVTFDFFKRKKIENFLEILNKNIEYLSIEKIKTNYLSIYPDEINSLDKVNLEYSFETSMY